MLPRAYYELFDQPFDKYLPIRVKFFFSFYINLMYFRIGVNASTKKLGMLNGMWPRTVKLNMLNALLKNLFWKI